MQLTNEVKVTEALPYVDGSADRDGAGIAMDNFEGILMAVKFAVIAGGAVTSIKAQQSDDDGAGDAYSDLLGTAITVAANDDDQIFLIDIYRPRKRFVRLVIDKDGANNTAEDAIYYQYDARSVAVDNNVTDLVTTELHISPAEGTA